VGAVTLDPRDYDPSKRDAALPEDGPPGYGNRPDTMGREGAREKLRDWDNYPPCPDCEETGSPVYDDGDESVATLNGCPHCRRPLTHIEKLHQAQALVGSQVVVVRRKKR